MQELSFENTFRSVKMSNRIAELEKEVIKKYANQEQKKDFLNKLGTLREIIVVKGSIDYNTCKYCSEIIKNWMEAMQLIDKMKEELV